MKAIIIGATSGIGRELAKEMSNDGYTVGVTGRRTELLESLANELHGRCFPSPMDLTNIPESITTFKRLLLEMGVVDIVVINSGTGCDDPDFPLAGELDTISVNVAGFTAIANVAFHHFADNGGGHIVGTSSILALRGGPYPSYNASKAYVSSYLEGLSCKARLNKHNIVVTDVRPGFVQMAMAKGDGIFWAAPVEKAASQILDAIRRKRRVVYITKRWRLIAVLLYCLPFKLYLFAICR